MATSQTHHRHRRLELALWGLAAALALNSILGPLWAETIRYHYSGSLVNQAIGLDLVALLLAAPAAIAAAVLMRKRHRAGPVLAFVPSTFAAYMAPQYVVGPEYLALPGNNERFFMFHLGIFVLALGIAVAAWSAVDRASLRPASTSGDRRRTWVMIGVAAFIALGRWLPAIADLSGGDPSTVDFLENPTAFLLIGVLDLGLVVPAAVAAAFGLRMGAVWAREASYAVIGWFALVPAAVAAMAVTMQVNGDPNANAGLTTSFVVAGVVFTAGAALLYRPMFGPMPDDGDPPNTSEPVETGRPQPSGASR